MIGLRPLTLIGKESNASSRLFIYILLSISYNPEIYDEIDAAQLIPV